MVLPSKPLAPSTEISLLYKTFITSRSMILHCSAPSPHLALTTTLESAGKQSFSTASWHNMEQYSHKCKLYWGQKNFIKTIPLNPIYNTPRFYLACGSAKFCLLQKKFYNQLTEEHLTFATVILDSEREDNDSHDDDDCSCLYQWTKAWQKVSQQMPIIPQELPEPNDIAIAHVNNPLAELLRWQYRLNHISTFVKMGLLPTTLTKARVPKCHKQPWCSHVNLRNIRPVVNIIAPGQCVSVDQLILPELGFIAQCKKRLTQSWYTVVTVFVDHFLRLKFIFFQKTQTLQEMLEAKHTICSMGARYSIIIAIMVALLTMDEWQMLYREFKLVASVA